MDQPVGGFWVSESGRDFYLIPVRKDDGPRDILRMVPPGPPQPFVTLAASESMIAVDDAGVMTRRSTGCVAQPGCHEPGAVTPPPCAEGAVEVEELVRIARDGSRHIWMRAGEPFAGLLTRPDGEAAVLALVDQAGLHSWKLVTPERPATTVPTPNHYGSWAWVRLP